MTLDQLLSSADGVGIHPVMPVPTLAEQRERSYRLSDPPARLLTDDARQIDRRHRLRSDSDTAIGGNLSSIASAAACATLDRLELAIVLLHSDGHVLRTNPAALRVAAHGDCFRMTANRLRLVDHQHQRVLETFLGNRITTNSARSGPLCVSNNGHSTHRFFLFAEWLNVPAPRGGPIASLLIYEPHLAGQLSYELLAHLHGLTKMESRLVAALYVAPVLQTAADRCGIAMNTAKTHLKHVFAKCGVCSKAELLRLLALGPRTL